MKDYVSSLNEKGVKAVVLGPESSDKEIKDAFEGKYNLVFTKSVDTDRGFQAASWTLENKNDNVQYYFEV